MKSFIKAISIYLPQKTLTNEEIVRKFPEWDDQKILNKIGVSQRYITAENEYTSDIAAKALENLISENNIDKSDIDFLIVCTQSPDYILPTTACLVQQLVSLPTSCAAIDINQGCSGYIYGLSLANGLIASGNFKNIVLITADTYSKYIHSNDKGNISIFGDGATATLISDQGRYRIGKFTLGTDGTGHQNLWIKNSGTRRDIENHNVKDNHLFMEGKKIFSFIMKYIPNLIQENLKLNNQTKEMIDLFVFHQANTYILEQLRKEMKIEKDKFVIEMLNCGNTTSSSIPMALKQYFEKNPHKRCKTLQLAGFGVGYSWGAVPLFLED